MNGLIVHDSRMFVDKDGNYYKLSTDNKHYMRYFLMADSVRVCMRTKELPLEECKKIPQITLDNFMVVNCPSIMGIKDLLINKAKADKIIEEEVRNSDFVVLKVPGLFCNIAYKYIKKYNKPFMTEIGGCPWDALWNHGIKGKVLAPYQFLKTRQIMRHADWSLYVTNSFLQNRYPSRGVQVNCSNVVIHTPDDSVLDKRIEKIEKNDNKIIIGTTAAVNVRYKGQQYIIEAIGQMKEHGIDNVYYQLVGGGDNSYLKSVAEKYGVSDRVEFLGAKPKEDVLKWLETIDVYAQPSRQEGLPRALIEAMSRGVPAIGAKTAGIPELLEDRFIFSNTKNNINEICDILLSMNNDVKKEQAIRNFNEAKQYDEAIINDRRNEFYKKFLQSIS